MLLLVETQHLLILLVQLAEALQRDIKTHLKVGSFALMEMQIPVALS